MHLPTAFLPGNLTPDLLLRFVTLEWPLNCEKLCFLNACENRLLLESIIKRPYWTYWSISEGKWGAIWSSFQGDCIWEWLFWNRQEECYCVMIVNNCFHCKQLFQTSKIIRGSCKELLPDGKVVKYIHNVIYWLVYYVIFCGSAMQTQITWNINTCSKNECGFWICIHDIII